MTPNTIALALAGLGFICLGAFAWIILLAERAARHDWDAEIDGGRDPRRAPQVCRQCGVMVVRGHGDPLLTLCGACQAERMARLQQGPVSVWPVCAWCGRALTADPRRPGQPISHGICPACAAKVARSSGFTPCPIANSQ